MFDIALMTRSGQGAAPSAANLLRSSSKVSMRLSQVLHEFSLSSRGSAGASRQALPAPLSARALSPSSIPSNSRITAAEKDRDKVYAHLIYESSLEVLLGNVCAARDTDIFVTCGGDGLLEGAFYAISDKGKRYVPFGLSVRRAVGKDEVRHLSKGYRQSRLASLPSRRFAYLGPLRR